MKQNAIILIPRSCLPAFRHLPARHHPRKRLHPRSASLPSLPWIDQPKHAAILLIMCIIIDDQATLLRNS